MGATKPAARSPRPVPDEEGPVGRLRRLLTDQRFAVLATQQEDGQPYASLLALSVDETMHGLVFATLRSTRKFAALVNEPRVALLVDDRDNVETDLRDAAAVTIVGRSRELAGADRNAALERFIRRHPAMEEFVRSPGCALMGVDVHAYYLVTRFQNVFELYPRDGTLHTTAAPAD